MKVNMWLQWLNYGYEDGCKTFVFFNFAFFITPSSATLSVSTKIKTSDLRIFKKSVTVNIFATVDEESRSREHDRYIQPKECCASWQGYRRDEDSAERKAFWPAERRAERSLCVVKTTASRASVVRRENDVECCVKHNKSWRSVVRRDKVRQDEDHTEAASIDIDKKTQTYTTG